MKSNRCQAILLSALSLSVFVQADVKAQPTVWQPTHAEILGRYKKGLERDSLSRNTVFKQSVRPNWMADGKTFWYSNQLAGGKEEYIITDATKGTKKPAFDNEKLSAALQAAGADSATVDKLRINEINIIDKDNLLVQNRRKWYKINTSTYTATAAEAPAGYNNRNTGFQGRRGRWGGFRTSWQSPDKEWKAFIKEGNLYVQSEKDSTNQIAFTTNGTKEKPYGGVAWAPDSKNLIAYLINPVKDTMVYFVRTSLPGTTRGKVDSNAYKQPGDPFTTYEMFAFNLASKKATKINTPIIDFFSEPALHWKKDNQHFLYEKVDRGHQRFRIMEASVVDGSTRNIVDEQTKTFIYEQRIYTHYLPDNNEIIWVSEKDGWRHIYLVDANAGTSRAITKGDWVVRDIDSIDAKNKFIWFRASGMTAGEDPYNVHYYSIGFDGKKLVDFTPARGNHRLTYSPDKKYYLDTYSEVNVPPVTDLYSVAGVKKLAELEKADASLWASRGFAAPEPFVAKARDGVTDIYGVVCKPSDFDPNKKYPIIENIYAGPQDAFVPKWFLPYGEMQSIAELGFIVVQIDGMGTANRSKAFHDVCWQNLADAGFADRILWMKALAGKYPQADITRVGLYGTSAGGQNSTGGLLFHPEFYKAAVSSCGCHDNRIDKQWWNEQWMGYPVGKHYDEQSNITNAWRLKGKLLLMVGEEDQNVPPESTFRLADALIKAKKDFGLLSLPGFNHTTGGTYGDMRRKDFFVKSLLNVEPPDRNTDELNTVSGM